VTAGSTRSGVRITKLESMGDEKVGFHHF